MRKFIDSFPFSLFGWLVCLAVFPGLMACSSTSSSEKEEVSEETPADQLYEQANAALEAKEYKKATRLFEEVERLHPYSQWATQAQLMAAFAAYEDSRYDEAILSLDRFIELHPGNKNIDYAYYLKAISYYEQISDVRRDQEMTERALNSLNALIVRFPNSKYARDSRLKRDLTLDHLAGKEMEIGRYYFKRGHVNAAINRFLEVVQKYETTTHIPEALHRLVEAYLMLGLEQEAVRVASVLGHNYPGSQWYQDSYDILDPQTRSQITQDKSFIDRTIDSLFKSD